MGARSSATAVRFHILVGLVHDHEPSQWQPESEKKWTADLGLIWALVVGPGVVDEVLVVPTR